MLKLGEIPFFGELSQDSLEQLAAVVSLHEYRRGEIIARVGEPGQYLQAIASGAVRVQTNTDRGQSFVLGPGQIFGEMSLFTNMPVSATVVAERDTRTWRMTRDSFLRFLDEEPLLHHSLTRLLIERLRYRTRTDAHSPGLALITSFDGSLDTEGFAEVLGLAVQRYSAGSQLVPATRSHAAPLDEVRITGWRAEAASGAYLLVSITPDHLQKMTALLCAERGAGTCKTRNCRSNRPAREPFRGSGPCPGAHRRQAAA
jgi:CRP-like cAMP-binding protein